MPGSGAPRFAGIPSTGDAGNITPDLVSSSYCDIFNKIISRPCFSGRIVLTPRLSGGLVVSSKFTPMFPVMAALNPVYRLWPDAPVERTG